MKPGSGTPGRAGAWLRGALAALAVLAAAAAVVSWDAQYVLVRAVKHNTVVAGFEAGIPDVGALIFAALGIALALHGKRAIRPRGLNVACVGISLAMNALASAPGWRDLAIWVMPSAVYALASDTFIGVVRAWAIARQHASGEVARRRRGHPDGHHRRRHLVDAAAGPRPGLHDRRVPPLGRRGMPGRARPPRPACPVAAPALPARKPASGIAPAQVPAGTAARSRARLARRNGGATGQPGKQDRLLALAAERHDLTTLPLGAGVRHRQPDRRRGRPQPRHRPPRAAGPRAGAPERPPPPSPGGGVMKYVLLIAIAGLLLVAVKWALLPSRRLPRHRVRHLRIRLRLRLHPGRGHATVVRAVAALGPVRRVPPQPPLPPVDDLLAAADWPAPPPTRSSSAAATSAHACACRWKNTPSSRARPAPARPAGWPGSSCATPGRSCPPRPSTTCSS